MNWRSEDCNEAAAQMAWTLRAISAEAAFVREIAIIRTKQHNGEMTLDALYLEVKNTHLSRSLVKRILLATGEFELLEAEGKIRFTDKGLHLFETRKKEKTVRGFSHCSAEQGENSRTVFEPNTHASSSTKQEREKEKENTDTKKNGKETGEQPAVSELNDPEELPQHDPNNMPTEDGMPQQDPYYTTTADGMPLRDPNYTPSAEVLALVPEQVRRYSDKHWYPFACWLFDEQGMQRWKEALVMQSSNKPFTELVLRHWSETVTSFVEHSYCYGALETVQCKGEILQKLSLYLRPQRKPALILKARLKWMELRNNATDERQLRFYDFMSQHCPNLVAMEQSLSFEEFDRLRQSYGKDAVLKVLLDMENEPKLQKRSCFLTARVWLEHRTKVP